MKVLDMYSRFLDVLTKILKAILGITLGVMVLIMLYQVSMRYIFENPQAWCEELALYLCIFSIMLGLGIASRSDAHLQVDFITRLYKPKARCMMTAVWSVVAIVVMAVFAYYSVSLMAHATAKSVTLPVTMAQIYTAFPIGAALVIIYSIEIAARNFIGFLNNGEIPPLPSEKNGGAEA